MSTYYLRESDSILTWVSPFTYTTMQNRNLRKIEIYAKKNGMQLFFILKKEKQLSKQ